MPKKYTVVPAHRVDNTFDTTEIITNMNDKLFTTVHAVRQVEENIGFSFAGETGSFSGLFRSKDPYEPISLEEILKKDWRALGYCLAFVIDWDKEELRKLYIEALNVDILSRSKSTSDALFPALSLMQLRSIPSTEGIERRMQFMGVEVKKLYDAAYETCTNYSDELAYLRNMMNSSWFRHNSYTVTVNLPRGSRGIYEEYPKRYNFLVDELRKLKEIIELAPYVIEMLEESFNPYKAFIHTLEGRKHLTGLLEKLLKNNRTEEAELHMSELDRKEFIFKQYGDSVDYFQKFKLLKTGKLGKKLFVRKTKDSIDIYVVPEGVTSLKQLYGSSGVIKVFGDIGKYSSKLGWLYEGPWIEEVLAHVASLEEEVYLSLQKGSKEKFSKKVEESRNVKNVLDSFLDRKNK